MRLNQEKTRKHKTSCLGSFTEISAYYSKTSNMDKKRNLLYSAQFYFTSMLPVTSASE